MSVFNRTLLLILLPVLYIQITTKCICLNGDTDEALQQELQKLGFDANTFKKVSDNNDYRGLDLYMKNEKGKERETQLMSFDLRDEALKSNFDFRKTFFFGAAAIKRIPYRPYCFQSSTRGFLLFEISMPYLRIDDCLDSQQPRRKAMTYLNNLAKIFVDYEAQNVRIATSRLFSVGCTVQASEHPVFLDLNIFYNKNDALYRHYFHKNLMKNKEFTTNIKRLYLENEAMNAPRPAVSNNAKPIVLNGYVFASLMSSVAYNFKLFYLNPMEYEINDPLMALKERLDEHVNELRKMKKMFISAEDLVEIFNMANLVKTAPQFSRSSDRSPSPLLS